MIVLYIAAALIFLLILGAFITYCIAFLTLPRRFRSPDWYLPAGEDYEKNKDKIFSMRREFMARDYERVYIKSFDGLKLTARYYHHADGAPLAICAHGYRSTPNIDFSGAIKIIEELGQNALVIEQRAHGESGGHTITFGIKEKHDCLAWIDYALERFGNDTRICLYGVSMGAASVLMTTGLDLPENVRAVVADCGYSSPAEIVKHFCRNLKLPVAPIFFLLKIGARLFGGFDLNAEGSVDAVKRCKVPVLLIHGDIDTLVPCHMSKEVYESCTSKKKLLIFPGAVHAFSYIVDETRYKTEVKAFIKENLYD